MRNISCSALALALALGAAALAACGPSGKQVTTAKQARYQGDKQQLFAVIKQTAQGKYKLQKVDEVALGLQTEGRWYSPEGQPISAPVGDLASAPDGAYNISLVVELLTEGDHLTVAVKPVVMRLTKGRSAPDLLDAKDPSIPGWALGKGDNLQVELHDALRQYELKGSAGASPAPAAPAAGSAGSASPSPSPDPAAAPPPASVPPPPTP